MDKIVFVFNNRDIHHDYAAYAFVIVEYLLQKQKSGVHQFVGQLNAFTEADFHRLNKRIQDDYLYEVKMNEKHLIIFYSVVHYACVACIDAEEKTLMTTLYTEQASDIALLTDKMLQFGAVISEKLRKDFVGLKRFTQIANLISID